MNLRCRPSPAVIHDMPPGRTSSAEDDPDQPLPDRTEQADQEGADQCCLEILDVQAVADGVGGAAFGAGSGLRGLADRAGALDGKLVVESQAGYGTRVVAEIPCAS